MSNANKLDEIMRALSSPTESRRTRVNRTRHINSNIIVVSARARLEALFANTYVNPARVRQKIERQLTKKSVRPEDIVTRIFINPQCYEKDWYGRLYPQGHHGVDRKKLTAALDDLIGALAQARAAAVVSEDDR